jgi:hypothetical protein
VRARETEHISLMQPAPKECKDETRHSLKAFPIP